MPLSSRLVRLHMSYLEVCANSRILSQVTSMKCYSNNVLPGGPQKNNSSPFSHYIFPCSHGWSCLSFMFFCSCSQYKYWRFMFSIAPVHVEHNLPANHTTRLCLLIPLFLLISIVVIWCRAEMEKIKLQCCSFWDILADLRSLRLLGRFKFIIKEVLKTNSNSNNQGQF